MVLRCDWTPFRLILFVVCKPTLPTQSSVSFVISTANSFVELVRRRYQNGDYFLLCTLLCLFLCLPRVAEQVSCIRPLVVTTVSLETHFPFLLDKSKDQ